MLLVRLAQKEEEAKELAAQVDALEIVVTALLRQMAKNDQQALIDSIEGALIPDSQVPLEGANAPSVREKAIKVPSSLNRHRT
jgi:hypothetical protein